MFLAVADIILVEAVVEVVACVLGAYVEGSVGVLVAGGALSSGVNGVVNLLIYIIFTQFHLIDLLFHLVTC